MKIRTRASTPADTPFLYDLYVDALKGYIEVIWGWNEIWQKNDFATALKLTSTYLIESDLNLLGYFQLEQKVDHDYLRMLILDKHHRSKGIGSIILKKLIIESQAKHRTLKLRVFKINTNALRFYQREGLEISLVEDDFYLLEYPSS